MENIRNINLQLEQTIDGISSEFKNINNSFENYKTSSVNEIEILKEIEKLSIHHTNLIKIVPIDYIIKN